MTEDNKDETFNASEAELFEALGHPTRIKPLQCLSEGSLAFSELRRAAGLEGNGVLAFHLGKLRGLVKVNQEVSRSLRTNGRRRFG
jgi:DNA-binding transcriptional ArsR family regulator